MKRIILSGGGTGGHIYPAVAVAEALKRRLGDEVELLFVGAEGKMEMEKVPALGYRIVGLPIAGLQRRLDWHNLAVPFKVLRSLRLARRTIRDFRADAVVGFGGYASAPVLWAAQRMGVPTVIQEQNSYAGVTNKILSRRARCICTAYEGMERFFPADRIVLTGKYYEREMQAFLAAHPAAHVWQGAFIDRMDYAYAAADVVVSRSGAGTVSELCLVAKPVVFVPSPNVAEDHQTKNARALEAKGAAVVVPDAECRERAMDRAVALLQDREQLAAMSRNLEALARPDAAERIVDEILKVMDR